MGLFTPFAKNQLAHKEAHPSYQVGQRARHWLNSQFGRTAQFLNDWQHRVGFRQRNYVIMSVLLSLLFYFLYDLLRLL